MYSRPDLMHCIPGYQCRCRGPYQQHQIGRSPAVMVPDSWGGVLAWQPQTFSMAYTRRVLTNSNRAQRGHHPPHCVHQRRRAVAG